MSTLAKKTNTFKKHKSANSMVSLQNTFNNLKLFFFSIKFQIVTLFDFVVENFSNIYASRHFVKLKLYLICIKIGKFCAPHVKEQKHVSWVVNFAVHLS